MTLYEDALKYHSTGRKGKVEVVPTKPVSSQQDLSLAYSPGVAEPCRMIAEKEDLVYEYTTKGNLVAVVSNGSAVLGLGNIGAAASKPVMEGKGILFKKFADIDVFDIELNAPDPDDVIRACEMLEPTFGGINLEDIKGPDCFYIEEELKKRLNIPVFHDDQHGTAVISGAAFLNALEISKRNIKDVKVVFSGGGAAAIACANLYLNLGVRRENLLMADSKGIIYKGRKERMNPYKEKFAVDTPTRTLAEALKGADAFIGVSVKDSVNQEMIKSMAPEPIVFAMANPDPEILPEKVLEVRPDAIMATGRSDYPNQVNNVLGFPYIFRGALDTSAKAINEEMKMAAVKALADLAKVDVPESVSRAYGGQEFRYGKDYLIPTPFDRRALIWVASAVAEAAMKSGVARKKIKLSEYREKLETLLGSTYTVMRGIKKQVIQTNQKRDPVRLVFPEGENEKILKAAAIIRNEKIGEPILLGDTKKIQKIIKQKEIALENVEIVDYRKSPNCGDFAKRLVEKRKDRGLEEAEAQKLLEDFNYYGSMMVETGEADGLVSGVSQSYPATIRPAIHTIGAYSKTSLAGIYIMITKRGVTLFADTTVNIEPSAQDLANLAVYTSDIAKSFMDVELRVAMLSFSNFGSNKHPLAKKVAEATKLVKAKRPNLIVDGEMQADTAIYPPSSENFPDNAVPGNANILIFPDLQSANIAYKLLWRMGGAEAIGPILLGMKKPVSVLQRACDVNDIVNVAAITAMDHEIRRRHREMKNQK